MLTGITHAQFIQYQLEDIHLRLMSLYLYELKPENEVYDAIKEAADKADEAADCMKHVVDIERRTGKPERILY
jgi:hypothetical protein